MGHTRELTAHSEENGVAINELYIKFPLSI